MIYFFWTPIPSDPKNDIKKYVDKEFTFDKILFYQHET